jgi:phosphoglycolate phosphatase
MAYNIILFDIDGTLCYPGNSIVESARYALKTFGIEETNDENLRRFVGPPLEHSFRDYYDFDESKISEAVAIFRDKLQKDGIQLYRAYPGIPELLEELSATGKTLAIVTSKIEHLAIASLEATGLLEYFEVISAQQQGEVVDKEVVLAKALNKLGIKADSSVVMIGDRRHNVEAAKTHGIDSIGVLWGYGTQDELAQEGATHITKNVLEIKTLIG